jgi:siderophore synthetase component
VMKSFRIKRGSHNYKKLTLNRNRMFDYGYGDGEDRPHASEFGVVTNALHAVTAQKETIY